MNEVEKIKNIGNVFFKNKQYKEAIEKYLEADAALLSIDESDEKIEMKRKLMCNLAKCRINLEDYDRALCDLDPDEYKGDNVDTSCLQAICYIYKNEKEKAKNYILQAIKLNKEEDDSDQFFNDKKIEEVQKKYNQKFIIK